MLIFPQVIDDHFNFVLKVLVSSNHINIKILYILISERCFTIFILTFKIDLYKGEK